MNYPNYPVDLEKEINRGILNEEKRECYEDMYAKQNYNKNVHHDEGIEEPKIGMTFDTIKELANFYVIYGKKMGLECAKDLTRSLLMMKKQGTLPMHVIALRISCQNIKIH